MADKTLYERAKKAIQDYVDSLSSPASDPYRYGALKQALGTPSSDVTTYVKSSETGAPQPKGQMWDTDGVIPIILDKGVSAEYANTVSYAHISLNATGVAPTINSSRGLISTVSKDEVSREIILTFSRAFDSTSYIWLAQELSSTSLRAFVERSRDTSSLRISVIDSGSSLILPNDLTVGIIVTGPMILP